MDCEDAEQRIHETGRLDIDTGSLRWNAAIAAANQAPHASSAAEVADALGVDAAKGLSDAEAKRRLAALRAEPAAGARVTLSPHHPLAPAARSDDRPAGGRGGGVGRDRRGARRGRDRGDRRGELLARLRAGAWRRAGDGRAPRADPRHRPGGAGRVDRRVGGGLDRSRATSSRSGPGEQLPADARLLQTADLEVDESALTGESLPVPKRAEPPAPGDAPLAERPTMVYAGCTVARGTGRCVVVATGRRRRPAKSHGAAAAGHSRPNTARETPAGPRIAGALGGDRRLLGAGGDRLRAGRQP